MWLLWMIIGLGVTSCSPDSPFIEEQEPPQLSEHLPYDVESYLVMGHISSPDSGNPYFDARVPRIPTEKYHQIFLLGDLAEATTEDIDVLDSADALFNLWKPWVHWAPGNHDYDLPERITRYTQKPLFYTFRRHAVTYLVLDTQMDLCEMAGEQLALIDSVCDTLTDAKYLVVMHHKLMWLYRHPEIHYMGWSLPNAGVCHEPWCTNPNNFMEEVFPMLDSVQQRGIQVICIAGDLGYNYKSFEYTNPNGVLFLGTGLGRGSREDKILELRYMRKGNTLSYHFKNLDDALKMDAFGE